VSPAEWRDRSPRRAADDRLPTTLAARAALALAVGHDGWRFLGASHPPHAPPWRREAPAAAILRRVWGQTAWWDGSQLQGREAEHTPPAAQFIRSPEEAEAPDARTPTTPWVGAKVHLTEPGEDDRPHLSTNLATTPGPTADGAAPPQLHAALEPRGLLPGTPRVDTGVLDADRLVDRGRDDRVNVVGPTRRASPWPAREGAGCDVQPCQIDGHQHRARCPAGQTSRRWAPAVEHRGKAVIKVTCSSHEGRRCDHVARCVRAKQRAPRRTLTLRPQPPAQARQAARQRAATEAFQAAYARRAGVEGTLSRGGRGARRRRARYVGLPRVHRGHRLTAAGVNVRRLGAWFLATSRAKTRITPFARLMAAGAAA
jgi:transposase